MQPATDEGRVILVNKPLDWTSFDVVNKLRHKLKVSKAGHAGTLDPLATGLLIVCTGKKTKEIESFMGMEKEYRGKLVLGATTASHDLETEVIPAADPSAIPVGSLFEATKKFTGMILQTPPAHSAVKVGGKRSYTLARKGRSVELPSRTVEVRVFEITDVALPEVSFRVVCSKGTYIRSLVRDYGEYLNVGAYLSELCRTRIGPYRLEDASAISDIETG
jgi:tRNA pseudouridine55 synthase